MIHYTGTVWYKLTRPGGKPVYVNMSHVLYMEADPTEDGVTVLLAAADGAIRVKETPEQIAAMRPQS